MELINPTFKICEEVLETILHFHEANPQIRKELILKSINKGFQYVSSAIKFLEALKVISINDDIIQLTVKTEGESSSIYAASIIKKGLTQFSPFKEYVKLLQVGKSEKQVLKIIKATYEINNSIEAIKNLFDKSLKYLEKEIAIKTASNKITVIPNSNDLFWIDENGHLIYNQEEHTKQIINQLERSRYTNPLFIDQQRIEYLKQATVTEFDLSKLIRLCEEINDAYRIENYFTVGMLIRALLDHVPPIFKKKSFTEIANNHGSKSFRDTMLNLENFSRKIADGMMHTQIRRKENLPNKTTVDCKSALDILLGELINQLE
jgi:hypothetical protein